MPEWERLSAHLTDVAACAGRFAEPLGFEAMASAAGLLHDIGKCSAAFQAYIREPEAPGRARGPDHSSAGAYEACRLYPGGLGRMLAAVIAGHHAGLPDHEALDRRTQTAPAHAYADWAAHTGPLPGMAEMQPSRRIQPSASGGFTRAFATRMLFSCLVDADSLETERFVAGGLGQPLERGGFQSLPALRERLREHMAGVTAGADGGAVNALRGEVLTHVAGKASLAPGLFTLTVPTGGGKTLASLSFALEHAVLHGLRRVIYVIPFTSIIEQTASVFRTALKSDRDVLEHHSSFDWARAETAAEADDEGPDGVRKLRRAAENWDAPVIVTTAVSC